MAKVIKPFRMSDGTVVPAGTVLDFGTEGIATFGDKLINRYRIPAVALEAEELPANAINPETEFKAFDKLENGDKAVDNEGKPVTIVSKGTGKSGYDALFNEFGNLGRSFEEITAGKSDEEIEAMNFVAYTNGEDKVCIDLYGADFISACESSAATIKAFDDVEATDEAYDKAGKKYQVLAKGKGKAWFKTTAEAFATADQFDDSWIAEGETGDDLEFVLAKGEDGVMHIFCYCPEKGVAVHAEKPAEAGTEAIMAAARRRWENGGRERYARMQAEAKAGLESIVIIEEDDAIRDNIKMELTDAGIEYEQDGDNHLKVEDNDDNAGILAKLAQTYPSINAAMLEAGIECQVSFTRK